MARHAAAAIPCLLALLLPALAGAETQRILLKNGEELFGEVSISVNGDAVVVETARGEHRKLVRGDIDRIESLSGAPAFTPPPASAPSAAVAPASSPASSSVVTPSTEGEVLPSDPTRVPPPSPVRPWYVERRIALIAAGVFIFGLYLAGVMRREADGFRLGFKRLRVLVLLSVLLATGVYCVDLQLRREARTQWRRPLHVAVVLLSSRTLAPEDVQAFRERAADVSELLGRERRRFLPDAERPFYFHVFGPVPVTQPLPPPPAGEPDVLDRLSYAWELRGALADVNDAAGVDGGRFDARMYVYAVPAASARGARFVEGVAEAGGEVGMVDVVLDKSMIDAGWIAVAHETLHTVGATDKYDDAGHARTPEGLAEPDLNPLYPQRFAEIMTGEVPLSMGKGLLVDRLDRVRVGDVTAREIGWR